MTTQSNATNSLAHTKWNCNVKVKHFFQHFGKDFFQQYGKQIFPLFGKHFFQILGKEFFLLLGKHFFHNSQSNISGCFSR